MTAPIMLAIAPDQYAGLNGELASSSERWMALAREAGIAVRVVDVAATDILEQLRGCQGLFWRFLHSPNERALARRLLPVVEQALGLVVFPDWNTSWHYDDKVAQSYLLQAWNIPSPKSQVFWTEQAALEFAETAAYPFVLKLAGGAGSSNVALIHSAQEFRPYLWRLFYPGLHALRLKDTPTLRDLPKRLRQSLRYIATGLHPDPGPWWEVHKNYALVQEFLPGNDFDTRVTVIGNRAFAFRRGNRPNDFRASGSGLLHYNQSVIDPAFIRLAFSLARKGRMQCVAIDGLYRGQEPVIIEFSYAYVSRAVYDCPGHWVLEGEPEDGELRWTEGHLWPEEAQWQDLMAVLREREDRCASPS